jgi:hypothetical protein
LGALAVILLVVLAVIFLLALNVLLPVQFQFDASLAPDRVRYRANLRLPLIPRLFALPDLLARKKRETAAEPEQPEPASSDDEEGDDGFWSRLPEIRRTFEMLMSQYPKIAGLASYAARAASVRKFRVSARVGTGDAYETALLVGALNAGAGVAVGLARRVGIRFTTRPFVRILPVYDRAAASAEISVIVSMVPLRGILAAFRLYREIRNAKRVSQSVVSKPAIWNTKA